MANKKEVTYPYVGSFRNSARADRGRNYGYGVDMSAPTKFGGGRRMFEPQTRRLQLEKVDAYGETHFTDGERGVRGPTRSSSL